MVAGYSGAINRPESRLLGVPILDDTKKTIAVGQRSINTNVPKGYFVVYIKTLWSQSLRVGAY